MENKEARMAIGDISVLIMITIMNLIIHFTNTTKVMMIKQT